jgi:heptosyltransferase III
VGSMLAGLPEGSRVAVIRLRSLGDCVLTTPALAILKRFRPGLRVGVTVEDRFREIFENHSDVDAVLPPTLGALRAFKPALCLNLHGGTRSAWLTAASGARIRAGFGHYRHQAVYNVRIPRAQQILGAERKVHTAEHLASAVFFLSGEITEIPRAKLGGSASAPKRPVAVIHPVAAAPGKTWMAGGFLAVAAELARTGLEPLFIGSAGDDLSAFASYRVVQGASLSEIAALLRGAALFVGNDSGPAHMAAACGLPVVTIFGTSDPEIWGPWRTAGQVVTARNGIAAVTEADVLEALARLRVPA